MDEKEKKNLKKRIMKLQERFKANEIDSESLDEAERLLSIAEREGLLSGREKMEMKAFRKIIPMARKILKAMGR